MTICQLFVFWGKNSPWAWRSQRRNNLIFFRVSCSKNSKYLFIICEAKNYIQIFAIAMERAPDRGWCGGIFLIWNYFSCNSRTMLVPIHQREQEQGPLNKEYFKCFDFAYLPLFPESASASTSPFPAPFSQWCLESRHVLMQPKRTIDIQTVNVSLFCYNTVIHGIFGVVVSATAWAFLVISGKKDKSCSYFNLKKAD